MSDEGGVRGTSGLVVLGSMRKQAEQVCKQHSSVASASVLALTSLDGGLQAVR